MDIDFEHVLLASTEIIADGGCLSDHDVSSWPFIDVIKFEFHRISADLESPTPNSNA